MPPVQTNGFLDAQVLPEKEGKPPGSGPPLAALLKNTLRILAEIVRFFKNIINCAIIHSTNGE